MTENATAGRSQTDDLFRVLGSSRRRFVLEYLASSDQPVSVEEVGDRLASAEDGSGASPGTVHASLLHVHLPMLAEAGLLTHDRDAGTLRLAPRSGSVRESLIDARRIIDSLRERDA